MTVYNYGFLQVCHTMPGVGSAVHPLDTLNVWTILAFPVPACSYQTIVFLTQSTKSGPDSDIAITVPL